MNVQSLRPSTVDQSGSRVIPNVSIEVSLIVQKFKGQPAGYSASYEEMSAWLGRDAREGGCIASARRILLRDHGILIETERGRGLRVATDAEKVSAATRDMGGARRAFGRASKKLETVNEKALTGDQSREYIARVSMLGALRLLSAPSAVAKVKEVSNGALLPSAAILDVFKG